ncbi:MAG: hypothetical protein AAGD96_31590 [Chloroflexota bacterium]
MKKLIIALFIAITSLLTSLGAHANLTDDHQAYLPLITYQINPIFSTQFIVDNENGRMFAGGFLDEETPVIFTVNNEGTVIGWTETVGRFNYEPTNDWLLVDTPNGWLKVLNATKGDLLWEVPLSPHSGIYEMDPLFDEYTWHSNPSPQYDKTNGQIYYFRDHQIGAIDSATQTILGFHAYELERESCGDILESHAPIVRADYDQSARLLYISFLVYTCTPWRNHTLLVHDVSTGTELHRHDVRQNHWFVAVEGNLYVVFTDRFNNGERIRLEQGEVTYTENISQASEYAWASQPFYDSQRNKLYQANSSELVVVNPETMEAETSSTIALEGELIGYSESADAFFFLQNDSRTLIKWEATNIFPQP